MKAKKLEHYKCEIGHTLAVIGGKYKPLILWHLYKNEVLRYNELQKILEKITPKMLIHQLRELEEDKLIERVVYPVVPPKVEYKLTKLGESIIPVLLEMKKWGAFYVEELKHI